MNWHEVGMDSPGQVQVLNLQALQKVPSLQVYEYLISKNTQGPSGLDLSLDSQSKVTIKKQSSCFQHYEIERRNGSCYSMLLTWMSPKSPKNYRRKQAQVFWRVLNSLNLDLSEAQTLGLLNAPNSPKLGEARPSHSLKGVGLQDYKDCSGSCSGKNVKPPRHEWET